MKFPAVSSTHNSNISARTFWINNMKVSKHLQRRKPLRKHHGAKVVVIKSSATIAACKGYPGIVVFHNQIAMVIHGIKCLQCIGVIETALGKCDGICPPIDGILDAVADFGTSMVLIKIDKVEDAKVVAAKAKRRLAMVGYAAEAKRMKVNRISGSTCNQNKGGSAKIVEYTKDAAVVHMCPHECFNWSAPCICANYMNGEVVNKCERHNQIKYMCWDVFSPHGDHFASDGNN